MRPRLYLKCGLWVSLSTAVKLKKRPINGVLYPLASLPLPVFEVCLFLIGSFSDIIPSSGSVTHTWLWEQMIQYLGNESKEKKSKWRKWEHSPPRGPIAEVEQPPFTSTQISSELPSFSLLSNYWAGIMVNDSLHVLALWHTIWKPSLGLVVIHSANKGEGKELGSTWRTLPREVFEKVCAKDSSTRPCWYFGQSSSFCGHFRYLESAPRPCK